MKPLDFVMAAVAAASITATSVVAAPLTIDFNGLNFQNQGLGIGQPAPEIGDTIVLACPDLKVSITEHPSPAGPIEVRVHVANVSSAPYVSQPNQQMLVINGTNGAASDVMSFTNLNAGETIQWTDTFHSFEFPATYEAYLSFDPDIRIDGNPQNDDCVSSNNQAVLTTSS